MSSAPAFDARAAAREATASVRKSGTSFAAGMAILPRPRREAMHAIYAFCRAVDDIADDEALSVQEKHVRLAAWREEIDKLYAGRPSWPAAVALITPLRAYDLPKAEFLMMIEGMEMDAGGPIVAPSLERLFAYTRRVAGSVGLISMPVFGAPKGPTSDRFALALGDALQLTNILRDIAEDAAIGRVYLPAELLAKHGAPTDAAGVASMLAGTLEEKAPLSAVARDLAGIAAQKFARAREALGELDWRTVRPALLMMGAYEAYLKKMTGRGLERIGDPVSMSRIEKMLIALRYGIAPPLKIERE
ncbi:MAG: squalene/phytoene synthase family protein [Parvularculaceae bacterium]